MQPLLFHHLRNYPPVEKPFPVVRRLYQGTASDVPESSGKKSGFSPCRGDRQEPNENVPNEPISSTQPEQTKADPSGFGANPFAATSEAKADSSWLKTECP